MSDLERYEMIAAETKELDHQAKLAHIREELERAHENERSVSAIDRIALRLKAMAREVKGKARVDVVKFQRLSWLVVKIGQTPFWLFRPEFQYLISSDSDGVRYRLSINGKPLATLSNTQAVKQDAQLNAINRPLEVEEVVEFLLRRVAEASLQKSHSTNEGLSSHFSESIESVVYLVAGIAAFAVWLICTFSWGLWGALLVGPILALLAFGAVYLLWPIALCLGALWLAGLAFTNYLLPYLK